MEERGRGKGVERKRERERARARAKARRATTSEGQPPSGHDPLLQSRSTPRKMPRRVRLSLCDVYTRNAESHRERRRKRETKKEGEREGGRESEGTPSRSSVTSCVVSFVRSTSALTHRIAASRACSVFRASEPNLYATSSRRSEIRCTRRRLRGTSHLA